MDPGLIQHMWHRNLFTDGRWDAMPFCGKMGNIGSEVHRACMWQDKGNEKSMLGSLYLGLELLDVTIDRTLGPRRRELCRARELFCDSFAGDGVYHVSGKELDDYFFEFAMAYQVKYRHR